mgnify:CR=1 FL=1
MACIPSLVASFQRPCMLSHATSHHARALACSSAHNACLFSIANINKNVCVGGCRISESGHMQICDLTAVCRTACPYQGGGFACRIGPIVLNTQSSRYYLHPGARRVDARSRESKLTAAYLCRGSPKKAPDRVPASAKTNSLRLVALIWRNIGRAYQQVKRPADPSPSK